MQTGQHVQVVVQPLRFLSRDPLLVVPLFASLWLIFRKQRWHAQAMKLEQRWARASVEIGSKHAKPAWREGGSCPRSTEEATLLVRAQVFCGVGDLVSRDRKTEFVFDRSILHPF